MKIILVLIVLGILGFFAWQKNLPTSDVGKLNAYQNDTYGFSFALSEGATTTSVPDESGETILIQGKVQIYIMPFDEDIVLTAERIKKDIPDLKMGDEKSAKVGETSAVSFTDLDQNTREIWFVRGGYLYQVSSVSADEKVTEEIMESWRWK